MALPEECDARAVDDSKSYFGQGDISERHDVIEDDVVDNDEKNIIEAKDDRKVEIDNEQYSLEQLTSYDQYMKCSFAFDDFLFNLKESSLWIKPFDFRKCFGLDHFIIFIALAVTEFHRHTVLTEMNELDEMLQAFFHRNARQYTFGTHLYCKEPRSAARVSRVFEHGNTTWDELNVNIKDSLIAGTANTPGQSKPEFELLRLCQRFRPIRFLCQQSWSSSASKRNARVSVTNNRVEVQGDIKAEYYFYR
ncbi:uncharacterized protein EV154DRAFT_594389 [Mucor mucedo]|uniref:uncharacterized protein n=1 Tax=Mucor mucedo TaxID=29922 RepID=UPI0022210493|nr:uncharacterized protein EV154DRAFT_594389 [Mucor mucedo]KAI7895756.1 hypothetical protein EV154DRAFT_594389 [Mucor mucedo]